MNTLRYLRIFPVLLALTICPSALHATSLTAGTTTINLSCTKGSTCTSSGTSTLAISVGTGYYTVTAPSVSWILVTPMTGVATTTAGANVLTFSPSAAWTTLGSGLYSTTVTIASLGVTSATVIVNLQVNDATPTLAVKGSLNILNPISYTAGGAAPSLTFTVYSSDGLPIAFTALASSSLTPEGVAAGWITPNTQTNAIAYSWGTTLTYTASASALAESQPGDLLVGSITLTPGTGAAITLPVSISIGAAVATVTAVTPSSVPLLTSPVPPGSVTLVVKGTNFVSSTGSQKTKVFIGAGQVLTDNVTVLSPNYLTIAIPYDSTGGVFKTAGATTVVIGVANGANPIAPSGATVPVTVTGAPIVSAITSASAFVEPVGAANPNVAPYDIISIFGTNFCPLCTGTNGVQIGTPDTTYYRFPTFVSPDSSAASPHKVTVNFSKPGTPATSLPGYVLFANNTQINVIVPGALSTLANANVVNVQVGYDTATPAVNVSAAFPIAFVAADPGIFTISSNGQGAGAIEDAATFILNTQTAAAIPTGTVTIYMTGLGIPDSVGTNVFTASPAVPTNCLAPLGVAGTNLAAPTGYLGTVLTPATVTTGPYVPGASYVVPAWTSIDGAIIRSALLQGNYAPCMKTTLPTVTIGGVSAPLILAGFVADSIAGLYQVIVTVPTPNAYNVGVATQFPVVVTSAGAVASQAGVSIWIQ